MSVKTIETDVAPVDIRVVRGDTFNKLLFIIRDLDEDGNEIPEDLTGYRFAMQIRAQQEAEDFFVEFTDENFYLGQTDEAIQYDIDQGNPEGTTKDEVHIDVSAEDMRFTAGKWYYDLEYKDTNDRITTIMAGRFELIQDVTRDIQYS